MGETPLDSKSSLTCMATYVLPPFRVPGKFCGQQAWENTPGTFAAFIFSPCADSACSHPAPCDISATPSLHLRSAQVLLLSIACPRPPSSLFLSSLVPQQPLSHPAEALHPFGTDSVFAAMTRFASAVGPTCPHQCPFWERALRTEAASLRLCGP